MIDFKAARANGDSPINRSGSRGLLSGLVVIFGILRASRAAQTLTMFSFASVLVIVASAYGQVRIVFWNKPFLDSFSRRDFNDYMFQLGIFGILAVSMLILNTAQRWLSEILKVRIREALIRDLIDCWMRPEWTSALAYSDPISTPTQHFYEDARQLSGLSVDLSFGLLQAVILTLTFSGLLWNLSEEFPIYLGNHKFVIPGLIAWGILSFSFGATFFGLWVGRAVVRREASLAAREAQFAGLLEQIGNHTDAISFAAGEQVEARRVRAALQSVLGDMRLSAASVSNFTMVTVGFGWLARVIPTVVAAPLFFIGKLSFGNFLVVSLASVQIQTSLDWLVSNFPLAAAWRSKLDRVLSFRLAVGVGTDVHSLGNRINFVEGPPGSLSLATVAIVTPSETMELAERNVEILRGDRVLVLDDSGANEVPPFFRVLAGVWPWGAGKVVRPAGEAMSFISLAPYFPLASLRQVLNYPASTDTTSDDVLYTSVLIGLGLKRLVQELDVTRDWHRMLSADEKRCIALARAIIAKPQWLIVDQLFEVVDCRLLGLMLAAVAEQLAGTTLIHFSRRIPSLQIFNRVLHVRRTPVERGVAIADALQQYPG